MSCCGAQLHSACKAWVGLVLSAKGISEPQLGFGFSLSAYQQQQRLRQFYSPLVFPRAKYQPNEVAVINHGRFHGQTIHVANTCSWIESSIPQSNSELGVFNRLQTSKSLATSRVILQPEKHLGMSNNGVKRS